MGIVADDNTRLAIRLMRDDEDDYGLMLRWLSSPHVAEWWNPQRRRLDQDAILAEYRPLTRAEDSSTACIIELSGRPIGYIQFYPWDPEAAEMRELGFDLPAGYWGIDIFIGEPDHINRGLGSQAVALIRRYLVEERGATGIALAVAADNVRAQRAYEKAGLVRKQDVLDTDTRDGKRIPSYLMASP
jgi:RimJ/RimL family protein N-acetyltransferase